MRTARAHYSWPRAEVDSASNYSLSTSVGQALDLLAWENVFFSFGRIKVFCATATITEHVIH